MIKKLKNLIHPENKVDIYKNWSLIGFMGSGKTTVGNLLASRLHCLFLDIDSIIELYADKTISDIFKERGEEYFRKVESKVIKKIYVNKNCVFACGGGVVLKKENMKLIRERSTVIYLAVTPEKVLERLKNSKGRPLIEKENREKIIENLMNQRLQLYQDYSDITVDTTILTPDEIVDLIIKKINNKQQNY